MFGSRRALSNRAHDNKIGKVIKRKPFSKYPENFKLISLIVIEKKSPKKSEDEILLATGSDIFKNLNRVQT